MKIDQLDVAKDATIAFMSTSALLLTLVLVLMQRSSLEGIRSTVQSATITLYVTVILAGLTLFVLALFGLDNKEIDRMRMVTIATLLVGQFSFFLFGVGQIIYAIFNSL